MDTMIHSEQFHIGADHPALPGHFPGAPIVPGVILLDAVVAAIERAWSTPVAGFSQVKFLSPARPGQMLQLSIERDAASARFRFMDATRLVAGGVADIAP